MLYFVLMIECVLCVPLHLCALPIIDTCLTRLHVCVPYASYPSLICTYVPYAPARLYLPISALCAFFLSCVVVSIVRYTLRLKNFRKATAPDFIPLKFIKFASNVIDSHIHNIIIKDLEKNKYILRGAKNSINKTHFQEKWKKQAR